MPSFHSTNIVCSEPAVQFPTAKAAPFPLQTPPLPLAGVEGPWMALVTDPRPTLTPNQNRMVKSSRAVQIRKAGVKVSAARSRPPQLTVGHCGQLGQAGMLEHVSDGQER